MFADAGGEVFVGFTLSSDNCRSLCSEECFEILHSASTSFQLKIKEAMYILWGQPSLNSQVKHLNLFLSY